MKISQEAKEKTKIKIIQSAVDLITKNGYKNTSLREIASNAGVSNPTIYNYFPSKENLLYDYLEYKHIQAFEIITAIKNFNTYTLREQIQTLIDTELELYLEDREFILEIADMVFDTSSFNINSLYNTNQLFIEIISQMLEVAIEAKEIERPPFFEYMPHLFWDYFVSIVFYWTKDQSKSFENTTQLIDHSMSLVESILSSNILSKVSNLTLFFIKNHLKRGMRDFTKKQLNLETIKKDLKGV